MSRGSLLQSDAESTTVELKLCIKQEDAYRDYFFVVSNKYGTSQHVVTLQQGMSRVVP